MRSVLGSVRSAAHLSHCRRPVPSVARRWLSVFQLPEPHLDTHHHQDTFHSHYPHSAHPHDPSHAAAVTNLLYNVPPASSLDKPRRRTLCALVTNESGVLSRVSGVLAGRGVNIDSLVVSETETAGLSRMTIVLKGGEDVDQARKQLEDLVQVWAVVEFAPHAPVVERELLLVKLSIVPPPAAQSPAAVSAASESSSSSSAGSSSVLSSLFPSLSSPHSPPHHSHSPSGYPSSAAAAITSHVQRQAIVELTTLFQGRVLDLTPSFILIELTGKAIKIDAFIELVRPFGIKELARSGVLAMLRGSITGVGSRGVKAADESKDDAAGKVDASQLPTGMSDATLGWDGWLGWEDRRRAKLGAPTQHRMCASGSISICDSRQ